jgi:hypothetical protein
LTPVIADPTPPSEPIAGEIVNFTTEDPAYACQIGASLSYYRAPELLQRVNLPPDKTTYVVYGGCLGNSTTAGIWTFVSDITRHTYEYSAFWQGKQVALTLISSPPSGAQALSGQFITNFSTPDPDYSCFNGARLQVWTLPDPKQLLAYDVCGQGKFGAWTFPAS